MVALLFLLSACTSGGGPRVMTGGDGFFDAPWPSDSRTIDGHPDLSGFPGRDSYDLVDLYASDIEGLDGFGTNAPIWLRFDRALDTSLLPDPYDSATAVSPILLVDVDPDSPGRGTLVPFSWSWQDAETSFQPDRLLTIQPLWGMPLHPARTYAVIVTTDIARPNDAVDGIFDLHSPDHDEWASVGETLVQLGIQQEQVAAVTKFTTQDPVGQLAVFVDYLRAAVSSPALDQTLVQSENLGYFTAWEGEIWLPFWQHGEKPFTTEGGGFEVDDEGVPVLAGWERGIFTLSLPRDEEMPAEGWPVVIYEHGTGGDHSTFANSTGALEPAAVLANKGLAGIGISLPLHGERSAGGDPELLSFNYFNPTAARGNFQQAVLDMVYLTEVLTSQPQHFDLEDEDGVAAGSASLDPDRVAYMGHSHGGIVGAMAAPWLGARLPAIFLSGAGGSLSLSVQYRKAGGLDIQALIAETFDLSADEEVVAGHPLLGMVQTLGETVDPINYAPYWHSRQPFWDAAPANVLMTTGLLDEDTPTVTAQVLAGAARLPVLSPVVQVQPVNELTALVGQDSPTSLNVTAWDGSSVSGGLAEFADEGHFAIFDDGDAAKLYATFLSTALSGDAPVVDLEID